MLFLAVRTARDRGWAGVEDRLEIATLRAGRVREAMLYLGVGERAEGTDGLFTGAAVGDVAELLAFPALGVLGGGEHLLHSPNPGEEAAQGGEGESVGPGHGNNHGGCRSLTTRFRVRVKVTCCENGDFPGIADGLRKRGEELVIIRGKEGKRNGANQ